MTRENLAREALAITYKEGLPLPSSFLLIFMIRRALEEHTAYSIQHTVHARQGCAEDKSRKDGPDLLRLHNGDPGKDWQEYQSY